MASEAGVSRPGVCVVGEGGRRTVLLVRLRPYVLVLFPEHLEYFGEQIRLLVVVVVLHELVPCEAVADEICVVGRLDVRRLQVDRVITTERRVMEERHVRCALREGVILPCSKL